MPQSVFELRYAVEQVDHHAEGHVIEGKARAQAFDPGQLDELRGREPHVIAGNRQGIEKPQRHHPDRANVSKLMPGTLVRAVLGGLLPGGVIMAITSPSSG